MALTSSLVILFASEPHVSIPNHFLLGYTGEVVQGLDIVKRVESVGSPSGTTNVPVIIADSGVI